MMIGQNIIKENLSHFVEDNKFPRFLIIAGPKGAGKKLLAEFSAKQLSAMLITSGIGVDDVRAAISLANKVIGKKVILFPDADTMSPAAKNSLLKLTEEPPNDTYIIMTLTDIYNTLTTIRSRSICVHTDRYTPDELSEYLHTKYGDVDANIFTNLCETPGEVDLLMSMNPDEFYSYVQKVVDNIDLVSLPNSFKIADKLSTKKDDGKYDLVLFFKAVMSVCADRLISDIPKYAEYISITTRYLQQLRTVGINRAMTFDNWVLDIREVGSI